MKWSNLKNGNCPKCEAQLIDVPDAMMLECIKRDCDFKIGEQRMQEIIRSPRSVRPEDEAQGWERHQK